MTRVLTTQNAQITTAAVEVETLTITGKMVTQSVFRQLYEQPLIAHDGTLNGVPWGIVNYHPDKCGESAKHWHIVWQCGDELLRSRVDIEPKWTYESEAAKQFVCAVAWERQQEGGTQFFGGKPPAPPYGSHTLRWRVGDLAVSTDLPWQVAEALQRHPKTYEYRVPKPSRTAGELWPELAVELRAEHARIAQQTAIRASLAALPHLFIAV